MSASTEIPHDRRRRSSRRAPATARAVSIRGSPRTSIVRGVCCGCVPLFRAKRAVEAAREADDCCLGHLGHMRTVPCPNRSRATNRSAPTALNTIVGQLGQSGHPRLGQTGRCPFHHPRAASSHGVGAEVLAAGGDCVDAVVATNFALGVLEPWMSGVGGGGGKVLYRPPDERSEWCD